MGNTHEFRDDEKHPSSPPIARCFRYRQQRSKRGRYIILTVLGLIVALKFLSIPWFPIFPGRHTLTIEQRASKILKENPLIG